MARAFWDRLPPGGPPESKPAKKQERNKLAIKPEIKKENKPTKKAPVKFEAFGDVAVVGHYFDMT